MNARSLSFIECGINFVTSKTLSKICDTLKIHPKQLFEFEYSHILHQDMKEQLNNLIDENPDKLSLIYKLITLILKA